MRGIKGTKKAVVFWVLFLSFTFSGNALATVGPVCSDWECPLTTDGFRAEEELNPVCFLEAFFNLIIDLLEENPAAASLFFGCLSGCFSGADGCDDTASLEISPGSISLKSGETQQFTADGGTEPYHFELTENNSGAVFDDRDNGTAVYIAGDKAGVIDTIQLTDDDGNIAKALITVTDNSTSNEFSIGPDGGILSFRDLTLEFPEGALETTTTCKITLESNPDAFPAVLESFSPAYLVELGEALLRPVKITFNHIGSAETGALGIYILDAGEWFFAGGIQDGNTVYSYIKELSLLGVGKGQKRHKTFSFEKVFGEDWVNATVAQYILDDQDKDVPISKAYVWPVNDEETVSFPQGKYQFCIETYREPEGTWYKDLKCSFGPVFDCVLSEDPTASPINFHPGLFIDSGRCPDCENKTE